MPHISPDASLMRHDVPDFAVSIMACAKKQMPSLREELDPLDAFFVADPGVDPLLGNEAIVLFVAKVRWRIDESLSGLG